MDLGNHAREHDHDLSSMTLNTATGLTSHLSSYASLSSLASMIGASGQFPLAPGGNGHAPSISGDLSTGAVPSPREARPITNWFQPILWTMIDETAEKVSWCARYSLRLKLMPSRIVWFRQSRRHLATSPANRFPSSFRSARGTPSAQVDQSREDGMENDRVGKSDAAGSPGACSGRIDHHAVRFRGGKRQRQLAECVW